MSIAADAPPSESETAARKARLSLLAGAPAGRLAALWANYRDPATPLAHDVIRAPEIGTVMLRGRAGATGAAFNMGEMTVARCSVRLKSGAVGHGYVKGRDLEAARTVALIDALAEDGQGDALEAAILTPLRDEAQARRAQRAAKADATKVEFFTMVRGEG